MNTHHDRILDSGFEKTLTAILQNLPSTRQTLLFSATQTKAIKHLARLSVKDAEYVSVHDAAESSTPVLLQQHYLTISLPLKLSLLYSFILTHLSSKTIVFLSTGKMVRFVYEAFCRLKPGTPLLDLHGKQSQGRRMEVMETFRARPRGVLFATDVAARGLDISAVDWVVQADCPDDVDTYIHRVGRTARNGKAGNALVLLLPSEKGFVDALKARKVPVAEIRADPAKTGDVRGRLAAMCSESGEMKYLGQKAFVTYLRSIHLQADKSIFDVHNLPFEEFAEALGLPGTPVVKFKVIMRLI